MMLSPVYLELGHWGLIKFDMDMSDIRLRPVVRQWPFYWGTWETDFGPISARFRSISHNPSR